MKLIETQLNRNDTVDGAGDLSSVDRRRSMRQKVGFALVNVWLVYHLFAIVIAPASVAPSSRMEQAGWEMASPYLQLMYLNHGFHFFSPEPGGSTLVSYVLEFEDGTTQSGQFPNKQIWPRLLYHRHFMLSEFLGAQSPERQQVLVRSYAKNLCREHGAKKVTVSRVMHDLAPMERLRAGGSLDDSSSFEEEPLGTFSCDEL